MKDLIEALTIFLKYGNPCNPTNCSHDLLVICGVDSSAVSSEDRASLERLGFEYDEAEEHFYSFRYGSA